MPRPSRLPALIALAVPSLSLAQVWQPLAIPEGGALARYYEVGKTVIGAASMTTYRSTDAGATWAAVSGLPQLATLNSAVVIGTTIVGNFPGAGVYRSADEGQTWIQVADAATSQTFGALVSTGGVIFARTNSGALLRSDDLGGTWLPVTLPADFIISQLGTDASHITIADFSASYTSTDLGQTWQPVAPPTPSSIRDLYSTPLNVLFSFVRDFAGTDTGLHRSTDGGATWTLITVAPPDLQEVDSIILSDSGLIALARAGSGNYFPMLSTDDGISWAAMPGPSGDFPFAVGAADAAILLTGQQGVQRTTNLGANWTTSNTGTFSIAVGALASSGHAAYTAGSGRTTLLRSTDGIAWTPQTTLPGPPSFIYSTKTGASPAQDELFISINSLGLYRSSDGGATFTPANTGLPTIPLSGGFRTVVDMVRVNPTTLILAVNGSARFGKHGAGGSTFGAEGFIRSTNNGASWSQSNSGFPTIGINEVFQPNWDQITNLIVMPSTGTVVATTRTQGIWRSTNAGASWQQANTGVPFCGGQRPFFGDAVAIGSTALVSIDSMGSGCVTLPTQVLKSTDDGATWTFSSTGMPVESRGGRMSVIDDKVEILLRPSLSSFPVIYESADAGATWAPTPSSPTTPLTAPQSVNGTQVAGTTFTGLWALVPPPACPGDTNHDNIVDGADLSVLLAQFNSSVKPGSGADFNADGFVNGADLSVLLANFGATSC